MTRQVCFAFCILSLLFAGSLPRAQATDSASPATPSAATITGEFFSAVVLEPETGDLLVAVRAHEPHEPASMTKMMTELLLLEAAGRGEISLADTVVVSGRASKVGGSQVYLKQGEVFTIEELLMALAIHSANDAALALAEHHAGSKEAFIDMMNIRAAELGMNDTQFHSVHGLPPERGQSADISCAYDMAILARELIKHPESLRWGSMESAPFRNGEFTLHSPNRLIGKYRGLDGLKTGYHHEAGFCITATAVQKDRRLIAVVMGAPTDRQRATEASRLLTYGFNLYSRHTLLDRASEQLQPVRVRDGKARSVPVTLAEPLTLSLRKEQIGSVVIEKRLEDDLVAPVEAGQVVGKAVAVLDGAELGEVPIVAAERVAEGSFFDKLLH